MKARTNAKQKREAERDRRKSLLTPEKPAPGKETVQRSRPAPPVSRAEPVPEKTPEEETLEFLEYLDRHGVPARKDETVPARLAKKAGSSGTVPRLNLEEGMPAVSEALDRMRMGLQETRHSRAKTVKLIHGYGSTGRGGKIRSAVREELAALKRKNRIRDYIPGEDFGPADAASRKLADRDPRITRDPDYGRMNHGITIVVLQE